MNIFDVVHREADMSKRHTLRDRHRRREHMEATTASWSKHSGWTIGVPKMRSETPNSILIIEWIGNRRSLESFHLFLILAGSAKILFFFFIELNACKYFVSFFSFFAESQKVETFLFSSLRSALPNLKKLLFLKQILFLIFSFIIIFSFI